MTEPALPVREKARAKINLALHVTGRREDGYHALDSLVAFADIADELEVDIAGKDDSLSISGPFAHRLHEGDEENIILRALARLRALCPQLPSLSVKLEKHLPVAAGIGGGSADAAAAIHGALALAGAIIRPEALRRLALGLGADVPVCLAGHGSRMRGVGDEIEPVALGPFPAILVNPGVACDTAEVFRHLARNEMSGPLPESLDPMAARNDLEPAAIRLVPVIADVLTALRDCTGVRLARMSGSGATCFGLFSSPLEAEDAARQIGRIQPGWWVRPVTIGG